MRWISSLTDEQQSFESPTSWMERYRTEQYMKGVRRGAEWPHEFTDALLENGFQMLGVDEEFGRHPCRRDHAHAGGRARVQERRAHLRVRQPVRAFKDMTEHGTPE